jgi:hypothetical protein
MSFFFYDHDENFLLVARGLFDPEDLRAMRDKYVRQVTEEDLNRRYGAASNSVRLRNDWFDIWRKARLQTLPSCIRHFSKVIYPPMLRTVANVVSYVPWHQDLAYMKDLGPKTHQRIMTCFVPLNDRPALHPSLRFSVQKGQALVPHGRIEGRQINSLGVVKEFEPVDKDALTFELELGDAFVFSQRTLHQTWFPTEQFEPRHSVEFRVTGADWLIKDKDYFDLQSMEFVKG